MIREMFNTKHNGTPRYRLPEMLNSKHIFLCPDRCCTNNLLSPDTFSIGALFSGPNVLVGEFAPSNICIYN